MKFLKFFIKEFGVVTVMAKSYNHSVEHVLELINEAAIDFPLVPHSAMAVVVFGEPRFKHMVGIQFTVSEDFVPDGYQEVSGRYLCDYYLL